MHNGGRGAERREDGRKEVSSRCRFFILQVPNTPLPSSCHLIILDALLLSLNDGDLNLNTRVDVDAGDLLDDLDGRLQVDDTLVDAHLKSIPGVGTLTAWGLTRGDAQSLRGQTDGTSVLQALSLRTLDQILTYPLEFLDLA